MSTNEVEGRADVGGAAKATDVWTVLLSIAALIVSALAYNRSSPQAVHERAQDAQMRQICGRAYVVDRAISFYGRLNATGSSIPERERETIRLNAGELRDALNQGIGLGLMEELTGNDSAKSLLFPDTTAILTRVALSAPATVPELYPLTLAVTRIEDQCVGYRSSIFPDGIREVVSTYLDTELDDGKTIRDRAWEAPAPR